MITKILAREQVGTEYELRRVWDAGACAEAFEVWRWKSRTDDCQLLALVGRFRFEADARHVAGWTGGGL